MAGAEQLSRSIAVFVGTTHERHWIFTSERLAELRSEANKSAALAVKEAALKPFQPPPAGGGDTIGDTVEPSPGKRPRVEGAVPECLTEGEEQIIQQYYLASLMDKSTSTLQLPTSVEATALAYFQRFYLHNSVMDYHPKDVMLTVLWVACKVEHYPTRFLKAPKVKIGDNRKDFAFDAKAFAVLGGIEGVDLGVDGLLRLEQVLLNSLRYHFMVFHPYRALQGLIDLWASFSGAAALSSQDALTLSTKGNTKLRDWLKTSLPLIYHPAELALAALKTSVKSLNKDNDKGCEMQSDKPAPKVPSEASERDQPHKAKTAKLSLDSFFSLAFQDDQQEIERLAKTCKLIESALSLSSKQRLKGEQLKMEATRINNKLTTCANPEKERSHPHHQLIQNAKRVETDRIKHLKATKIADEERQKQCEVLGLDMPLLRERTGEVALGLVHANQDAPEFLLATRPPL